MRCRNANPWLSAQRDGDLPPSPTSGTSASQDEQSPQSPACFSLAQHHHEPEPVFPAPTPFVPASISTDQIMQAVQLRKHVSQQLEDLRQLQLSRVQRIRHIGAALLALGIFTLSCVPLLFLALTIVQTELTVKTLNLLNGVIDIFIILAQYLQLGLTWMTRDSRLLSGVALAAVIMTGIWLRLMRPPREA